MDLRVRDHAGARHFVRRRRACARMCGIHVLVVEQQTLAVRTRGGDVVKHMARIAGLMVALLGAAPYARAQDALTLHTGWQIQSSAKAGVDGARISSARYAPRSWYKATVPSTVVGALVD